MKKILFCSTILVLLLVGYASQAATSSKKQEQVRRIVDQISTGRTEEEVVALLSETVTLVEDKSVNFTDLCRYEYILKVMRDVANYDATTQQYTLYPEIVKRYVVEDCAALWPQNARMEFYFQRPYGTTEPFTLYIIRSVLKVEVSDMATAFNKYVNVGIENRHGKEPLILNTSYHGRESDLPLPTKMAMWDMTTTREYLFVADNGVLIFPEFVYVDKLEQKTAMESIKKYREAQKSVKPTLMYTPK